MVKRRGPPGQGWLTFLRNHAPDIAAMEFQVCDAHGLTFKDGSFDVCRAERVLLYLENPATAVVEMARVTRPGGHVIVFDFDYGASLLILISPR
jgi:ubiquinone/menaquinone biosynthesis C-methylase UbiE